MSTDWQDRPTLFADYGSVLCFPCGAPGDAYTAQQLGAKSIAVDRLRRAPVGGRLPGRRHGHAAVGLNVSFTDLNLVYGADPTPDVLQMKANNVDLLFTCLDVNGNVAFARAISQNGLTMKQMWFNGYDRGTLAAVRVDHERASTWACSTCPSSPPWPSRRRTPVSTPTSRR